MCFLACFLRCFGGRSGCGSIDARIQGLDVETHGPFLANKWGYSTKGQNAIVQIDIL